MADAEKPFLRIYCVCGQKMKVTGSLFGRPGKCVACRQKIRIPRFEEIEDGIDTIHLKDHPEFLRGSGRTALGATGGKKRHEVVLRKRGEDEPSTPPEEEPVELGDDSATISTVPLDVLEPLRNLFCIEYKLTRQLKTLDEDDSLYAEVEGRLARTRDVRQDLDERLRQMLMEVAIELATTHDKIAQTQLSGRIGEIGFDEFKRETYRQRTRRDRLERRQQNLRGWLATINLSLAGGFVDVPPDAIPEDGFSVHVPEPAKTTAPLVDVHSTALREAFERRAAGERKIDEIDRMREAPDSRLDWKTERGNAKSSLLFADANIRFCQERLTQLQADYNEDLETISAQADFLRARMQSGQTERAEYDKADKKLVGARTDLKKALSLVERSLSANSAQDVPQPKGTFLDRMAAAESETGEMPQMENGLVWGAAGLLGLALFLPLVGNLSLFGSFLEYGDSGYSGHWTFLILLLFAGGVTGASVIKDARVRIGVLSGLFILGLFITALVAREAMHGIGPVSARFRTGPPMWIRPGMVAIAAAAGAVLASLTLSARRLGWGWPVPIAAPIQAGLLIVIAASELLGALRPAAEVNVGLKAVAGGQGRLAQVTIRNSGRRSLHLVPAASKALSAYQFFLERRVGETSWDEIEDGAAARSVAATIPPGGDIKIKVRLGPGDYRSLLLSKAYGERIENHFTVAVDVAEPVEAEPEIEPEAAIPPEPRDVERYEEEALVENEVEVEFRGAGVRAGGNYRFSFVLYLTGGDEQRIFLSRGQEVYGGWRVAGYDAESSVVRLSRNGESVNLGTGEFALLAE